MGVYTVEQLESLMMEDERVERRKGRKRERNREKARELRKLRKQAQRRRRKRKHKLDATLAELAEKREAEEARLETIETKMALEAINDEMEKDREPTRRAAGDWGPERVATKPGTRIRFCRG